MKTHKNLYAKVISFENLVVAAKKASLGKGNKYPVMQFRFHLEDNLVQLHKELKENRYKPGPYRSFYIMEPKKRLISAAPFRDRVVHHALCNIIEPIFNKTFVYDSYANRKGKGTHAGIRRVQHYLKFNRYVLQCDIKKYFPSIDHEILKNEIKRKISDPDLLFLIDTIVDASNEQEFVYNLFPGDDLFTPLSRRKGLPLGNLTSQFFANIYLNRFDHYVKEQLKVKCYARYVDDFIIASHDKESLKQVSTRISEYFVQLRLLLHPGKCHILKSVYGVNFLGQRIFPDFRLLKKDNVKRFCKRIKRMERDVRKKKITLKRFAAGIAGWKGHAEQANTYRLREGLIRKYTQSGISLL
ncbi:MAG: RNA-dependent DNA polymerase [Spirochaetales bacterium]|nr:RNA-dependent DNA polymerase [Spirochaetales bacterium]